MERYEELREARLLENKRRLAELKIEPLVAAPTVFKKPVSAGAAKRKRLAEPEQPLRRSLRQQGVTAKDEGNGVSATTDLEAITESKSSVSTKPLRASATEPITSDAVLTSVLRGDQPGFTDARIDAKSEEKEQLREWIVECLAGKWSKLSRKSPLKHSEREWDGMDVASETEVAKLLDHRTYSVAFLASDSAVGIAGSVKGEVGVWNWDVQKSKSSRLAACTFKFHTAPVTSILPCSQSTQRVYTSSYDGLIRVLDLESETVSDVICGDRRTPWANISDDLQSFSFTAVSAGRTSSNSQLVASDSYGRLVLFDPRTPSDSEVYSILPGKKVHTVHVNPADENYFVTSDRDATVKVWDRRLLRGKPSQRTKTPPGPVGEYCCSRVQSFVKWSPCGTQVASIGFDDLIHIWKVSSSFDLHASQFTIKHNNQTGRWLTPLNVDFFDSESLLVGSLQRTLQVFSAEKDNAAKPEYRLSWEVGGYSHPLITAVMSVNAVHPKRNLVLSGVGSGRCYICTQP
ncbi:DNA damage-binding protein CMR1 [Porphyridium purpureum]|uniref:DNA damage-binding protein CMR1 n=1 Tax=Porphyridium purpureum TaxID=35688 RepID=A0A5J4Z493_PORPP|nr:DNA damage-binding protein CMR1 [Porphyridium purpureum]|eukprot:POR0992..scf295_1